MRWLGVRAMSNDATHTKAGGMRNHFSKLGQRPTIIRHYRPIDSGGFVLFASPSANGC
jgi:hypothetical protein